MLTRERKSLLLKRLKKDGRIVAKELSAALRLSEDTIRRDLRELAAEGLLLRVHGGALPASPTVANLASRRTMAVAEKITLGHVAAQLIRPGQSVFIDGGTTNLELVRALPLDTRANVFTHSPAIAAALEPHGLVDVVLVGGKLFRHSMVATGASALQTILSLRVDLFFLGVTGVHATEGLSTGDFDEAVVKRAIADRAADVVSIITSDKIGAVSAHHVIPLPSLSAMIVAKSAKVSAFRERVKILRA